MRLLARFVPGGEAGSAVGSPALLAERIQMESGEDIDPAAQPIATESCGPNNSGSDVGARRNRRARAKMKCVGTTEQRIHPQLGSEPALRRCRRRSLRTRNARDSRRRGRNHQATPYLANTGTMEAGRHGPELPDFARARERESASV